MSAPAPKAPVADWPPAPNQLYNPRLTTQDLLTIPCPTTNQWLTSVRADDHLDSRVPAPNSTALRQLTTCELLDQLHSFRMRDNEFTNIDLYDLRLRELIHQLKTAGDEPQPISRKQHKRVYLAGLRAVPHYDKTLNTLYDIDNKDIKSIHNVMCTVCAAGIRASSARAAVTLAPKQFRYQRQRGCCTFSPAPVPLSNDNDQLSASGPERHAIMCSNRAMQKPLHIKVSLSR